jgi:hypothetical protein
VVSLSFDMVFFVQHYVLYPPRKRITVVLHGRSSDDNIVGNQFDEETVSLLSTDSNDGGNCLY